MSRTNALELPVVEMPKKANILADILREKILGEELREGDSLPSEREMMASTGLSRSSVREAINLLEIQGLVKTRPGRNGGSVVSKPRTEIMVEPIELFIRAKRLPFRSLTEVRESLEPAGARLAALNRVEHDLEKLDLLCDQLEENIHDVTAYLDINMQWHMAVMEASHNELLFGFMKALSNTLHAATDLEEFNSQESRQIVARVHRKIVEAIRDQDGDAAKRRMERHVQAYSVEVAPHAPGKIVVK